MYLKKAIRGAALVTVFTLCGSLFAYLFRISLARSMSVAEYGLFYSMFAFFSFLAIFFDLGLSQAVAKFAIEMKLKGKLTELKSLVVYTLLAQLAISAVLFLFFVFTSKFMSESFFKTDNTILFIFMGIWFLTLPIPVFLTNIFLSYKRSAVVSSLESFRQVAALILSLVFFSLNFGIKSPFLAYACLNILMLFIYTPLIIKTFPEFTRLKLNGDWSVLVEIFKYGMYLSVSSLLFPLISQADTLLLTFFKSVTEVGLYQAALPIAAIINFFSTIVVLVVFPVVAELHSAKKQKLLQEAVRLTVKLTLIASLPISIMMFAFSDFGIRLLFGADYMQASDPLKILVIATLFSLLNSVYITVLSATGRPKEIAKIMAGVAVLNVVLNIALIPLFSIVGAAAAALLTFIIAFILSSRKIKSELDAGLEKIVFAKAFFSGLLMLGAAYLVKNLLAGVHTYLVIVLVGAISFSIYLVMLFALRIVTLDEIKTFASIAIK